MTTIKDVADAAGVSTATVSRVLADKPHIRPEIRARVAAEVARLNYRPNRVARSLRVQRSNTIGLIVSDIQNPFFTAVSRAVEDVASEHDLSVVLCNTDEDPAKEAMYLELMQDENVAGIILSPTQQIAENFAGVAQLEIPMVVIDRRVAKAAVDNVVIDNMEAAYQLTGHVMSHGYRRIAAIFGHDSTTGRERHDGYVQACKAANLKPAAELMLFVPPREADGYRAARQLLALREPPDALLTSNALLAAGAFRALREQGIAIPEQIAFVGFDDAPWSSLVEPSITVIAQPTYEIGQTAIELLLKRMDDPSRPTRQVILTGQLIVRESCGAHPPLVQE